MAENTSSEFLAFLIFSICPVTKVLAASKSGRVYSSSPNFQLSILYTSLYVMLTSMCYFETPIYDIIHNTFCTIIIWKNPDRKTIGVGKFYIDYLSNYQKFSTSSLVTKSNFLSSSALAQASAFSGLMTMQAFSSLVDNAYIYSTLMPASATSERTCSSEPTV